MKLLMSASIGAIVVAIAGTAPVSAQTAFGGGAVVNTPGLPATAGVNGTAVGDNARATGKQATATGTNSQASGIGAVTDGGYSRATGDFGIASGYSANAAGLNSSALGYRSSATGEDATASARLLLPAANKRPRPAPTPRHRASAQSPTAATAVQLATLASRRAILPTRLGSTRQRLAIYPPLPTRMPLPSAAWHRPPASTRLR